MADAPLMISVSGARGIAGASMTGEVASRYATAFAAMLGTDLGCPPHLCLARDTRPSGGDLSAAVSGSLVQLGCRVTDLGVVATPTAGVMVTALGADGGIVITASHNPSPWNGVKCLDGNGTAPAAANAERIVAAFHEGPSKPLGPPGELESSDAGHDTHIARVLGAVDPLPLRERGFRVVLDSINGAGCESGRRLLAHLGCDVVHVNSEPSGDFAHAPEPIRANLGQLMEVVADSNADIGFAQDPDADRLVVVDEHGAWIGEECTLVLAAMHVLDGGGGDVAVNLSTSRMIDDVVAASGGRVHRTAVGEAHVAAAMREHDCVFGGEGNGGVIYPPIGWVRDSLGGMALVLDLLRERGQPMSAIVAGLPAWSMVKRTMDLSPLGGSDALSGGHQHLQAAFEGAAIDVQNGLRIDLPEGWVHVRASNTEPIARIIAEGHDASAAADLADRAMAALIAS